MYRVEMTIVAETAESLFVGFDGEMQKLHNIRAYEAVHLLVRAYRNTSLSSNY